MREKRNNFGIVVHLIPEMPGYWRAHCLDTDDTGDGPTIKDALVKLSYKLNRKAFQE